MRTVMVRHCKRTEPHIDHVYTKHWRLVDLPLLREPERYPAEWDSIYRCPGTSAKQPGKTLAESLGIVVPENAPGGQKLIARGYLPRGIRQNRTSIEYDGFYDTDAYGGPHDG